MRKPGRRWRGRPKRENRPTTPLPTLAQLRTEAVAALFQQDARVVRELGITGILPPALSPDGRLAAEYRFEVRGSVIEVSWRVVNVLDGNEVRRWSFRPSA